MSGRPDAARPDAGAVSGDAGAQSGEGVRPVVTVDALGRRCPQPVIMLAQRIGEVAPGEVVGVLADDEAARLDVPAWCEMRGQTYLGEADPGELPKAGREDGTDRDERVGAAPTARLYLVRREA